MSTLLIEPYDPAWPSQFAAERRRLLDALGSIALRIDHNGSTAVPGLAAKPVIDIQISVARLAPIDTYCTPLERIGYVHLQHADDAFAPFFYRPATWPHTHHIHVVEAGGEEEARTLAFRDYLRDHPAVAQEYAALKVKLAQEHSAADAASREAYAQAKSSFIEEVILKARAGGYPRLD